MAKTRVITSPWLVDTYGVWVGHGDPTNSPYPLFHAIWPGGYLDTPSYAYQFIETPAIHEKEWPYHWLPIDPMGLAKWFLATPELVTDFCYLCHPERGYRGSPRPRFNIRRGQSGYPIIPICITYSGRWGGP
jgi:hypothetical protein